MVPLLALLALLTLSRASPGAGTVEVQAPARVSGMLGGSLTLPCHLKPLEPNTKVTQVTWMRQGPKEDAPSSVGVRHPTRGPSVSEPERVKFASTDLLNASLVVTGLRVEDEANYTCQFATFPQGSGNAGIQLRVLAQPEGSVEPQEVPLGPLTGVPVPVARCTSTGGRPPPRITWAPPLTDSINKTLVSETLNGTYTVISLLTLVPSSEADGRNVTCRVEHETLEEPVLLPVTLAVHYPPEVSISGYDGNWYMGQSEVALNCEARSNPAPTAYTWNTTTGSLPSLAGVQGSKLRISTVDHSINTTFICQVTNALGTGQREQTILVKDREASHVNLVTILVPIGILLLALVAVGFLLYRCCSRRRGREQSRPPMNGDISYSGVAAEINEPLDGSPGDMR